MWLTRTSGAHSRASALVRAGSPALAAVYAAVPGCGSWAETLPMLTTEPPPGRARMTRWAACAT